MAELKQLIAEGWGSSSIETRGGGTISQDSGHFVCWNYYQGFLFYTSISNGITLEYQGFPMLSAENYCIHSVSSAVTVYFVTFSLSCSSLPSSITSLPITYNINTENIQKGTDTSGWINAETPPVNYYIAFNFVDLPSCLANINVQFTINNNYSKGKPATLVVQPGQYIMWNLYPNNWPFYTTVCALNIPYIYSNDTAVYDTTFPSNCQYTSSSYGESVFLEAYIEKYNSSQCLNGDPYETIIPSTGTTGTNCLPLCNLKYVYTIDENGNPTPLSDTDISSTSFSISTLVGPTGPTGLTGLTGLTGPTGTNIVEVNLFSNRCIFNYGMTSGSGPTSYAPSPFNGTGNTYIPTMSPSTGCTASTCSTTSSDQQMQIIPDNCQYKNFIQESWCIHTVENRFLNCSSIYGDIDTSSSVNDDGEQAINFQEDILPCFTGVGECKDEGLSFTLPDLVHCSLWAGMKALCLKDLYQAGSLPCQSVYENYGATSTEFANCVQVAKTTGQTLSNSLIVCNSTTPPSVLDNFLAVLETYAIAGAVVGTVSTLFLLSFLLFFFF